MGKFDGVMLVSDYDDTLYNTPHPRQGVVEVHTDYTSGTYYLRSGGYRTEVLAGDYVIPDFFDPGTYTFVLFNLPQGMTEQGGTLTVDPLADGTLTPQPGTLHAASTQAEVLPDDTLRITPHESQFPGAPGQIAAVYSMDGLVLAGGILDQIAMLPR